jgi:hypothetical protein
MEEVYPRVETTEVGEVYLRQAGASRVVYFPGTWIESSGKCLRDHGSCSRTPSNGPLMRNGRSPSRGRAWSRSRCGAKRIP